MSDAPPPWPHITGPLDDVNEDFHRSYDTARGAAEEEVPVLIFLGDALIVYRRGKRRERTVTPRLYHAIKSAAHAPITLYAALYLVGDGPLDRAADKRLAALRKHSAAALENLTEDIPHDAAAADLKELLESTIALIDRTVAAGRASAAVLETFAGNCGPALLRLTDHATGAQLDALHRAVEETLAEMSTAERAALQVVVAGPHQARERSVAMQYFRKRLAEPDHGEERVAYAENAADERAALALVGTRRLDRAIAGAFFGDERRLQRDLLGDAAAAQLRGLNFADETGRSA